MFQRKKRINYSDITRPLIFHLLFQILFLIRIILFIDLLSVSKNSSFYKEEQCSRWRDRITVIIYVIIKIRKYIKNQNLKIKYSMSFEENFSFFLLSTFTVTKIRIERVDKISLSCNSLFYYEKDEKNMTISKFCYLSFN